MWANNSKDIKRDQKSVLNGPAFCFFDDAQATPEIFFQKLV